MGSIDLSDYENYGPLHEMFIRQALKTPNKIAVNDFDGRTLTFKELNDYTDVLATYLVKRGFYKGDVGGILMERSLEYVISYIAIHKAGGAYLPLETSYPPALLESVLKDANPVFVLTKEKYIIRLQRPNVISLEGDWLKCMIKENEKSPTISHIKVGLDDKAYVVYSSGTTGEPKGIICPHRGAVHAYIWRQRAYPYNDDEREACNVFFVWEMLRPLLQGIPLYIISDEEIYDPPKVIKYIKDNRITRILFTPSLLETIVKFKGVDVVDGFKSLRLIIFCGEVVTTIVRDQIASLCPWIKLVNLYSISETHDVSAADISNPNFIKEGRQYCSVGTALPMVKIFALDENLNEKSFGEAGDLYIGGPALATGYLNRPDLNKTRFIEAPPALRDRCNRLYNTGDWGFALGDGSFEIVGRSNTMVKIRGYTVELQAIEVAIRDHPSVKTCCVLCVGEEGQNKVLVAYVVSHQPIKSVDLRSYLKTKFPFYMIPSKYFFLDNLPILKSSGKLNKSELPKLDSNQEIELDDSMSDIERKIATLWCNILNLYTIEKDENFFDVGGHSLLAVACIGQMNESFSCDLSVQTLFTYPTVELMAGVLQDQTSHIKNIDLEKEIQNNSYEVIEENVNTRIQYFWKSVQLNKNKLKNGSVLLTGVTGYLGIHLLQKLLTKTQCTVYCTVRDIPNRSILERIADSLSKYNIKLDLDKFRDRLICIKADLSLENLGFKNKDEYLSLSYEIDMIIHAAAFVNLILPYHALYKSNVLATKNLIEFSFLNKIKYFNYVSTDGIYPSTNETFQENFTVKDFNDYVNKSTGYGQSKLVSEYLVLNAGRLELPISIVRLGNIGGSLEFKNWNNVDFNLYMLQGIIKTKTAPDSNWQLEFTPVDFLTDSLIDLYTNMNYCNKIYNFVNRETIPLKDIILFFRSVGFQIETASYSSWVNKVAEHKELSALSRLIHDGNEEFLYNVNKYDTQNTNEFLKSINKTYPTINEHCFTQYINNLIALNLIPNIVKSSVERKFNYNFSIPQENGRNKINITFDNSIKHKIIFITGCSSGIGKQLVQDLVDIGGTVIAIARRLDRLEILKKTCENKVGKIVIKQLDVTIEHDVKKVVSEVIQEFGHIDILINNAGVMYYTLIEKYTLKQWNNMIDVNIKGVLHCIGNILPNMITSGSGHIVNISSNAGVEAFAGLGVYTGTKYFVEGLSGALRKEVSEKNIKVTTIRAGDIETELLSHSTDSEIVDKFDMSSQVPVLKTSDISKSIVFALLQPFNSAVNSILIEPPLASI